MADLKKLTEDATTRAALAAGRDAARRAVDDLLTTDEEKAARAVAKSEASKGTRWKLIAFAVLGLCLFVGLVGMLLSYWYWFLALGVLGVGGIYAYFRLRSRLSRGKPRVDETEKTERPAIAAKVRVPVAEETEEEKRVAAKKAAAERRAEAEARARAEREARVVEEQEVDDELAALKARMKK